MSNLEKLFQFLEWRDDTPCRGATFSFSVPSDERLFGSLLFPFSPYGAPSLPGSVNEW